MSILILPGVLMAVCMAGGALLGALAGAGWLDGSLLLLPMAGQGLRALSLSGGAGDTLAWALYLLLSLLPLLGLLPAKRGRGLSDALFLVAAVYGLWYWYMAVNPTLLSARLRINGGEVVSAMAGGLLILLVLGGIILRVAESRESAALLRGVSRLLVLIGCLSAFTLGLNAAASLRAAAESGEATEIVYSLLLALCSLAPGALLLMMLCAAHSLTQGIMKNGWFAEGNVATAKSLEKAGRRLLIGTVLCEALAGALAMIFLGQVHDSHVMIELPLAELMAALCCVLLARFVEDGARIQRENDEFV